MRHSNKKLLQQSSRYKILTQSTKKDVAPYFGKSMKLQILIARIVAALSSFSVIFVMRSSDISEEESVAQMQSE